MNHLSSHFRNCNLSYIPFSVRFSAKIVKIILVVRVVYVTGIPLHCYNVTIFEGIEVSHLRNHFCITHHLIEVQT